jgi:WD40 repeat protein
VELAAHPDGELLASASWDGSVRLWHTPSGREQLRAPISQVRALRFSQDGRYLGPGDDGSRCWIWELADGHEFRSLDKDVRDGAVTSSVDFLWPMGILISAGPSGLRFVALNGAPSSIDIALPGTRDVVASPDSACLYTSSAAGVLRWPVSRSEGRTIVGPPETVAVLRGHVTGHLRLSRDGKSLAVVVDQERGRVLVLDPTSGSPPVEISGHRNLDRLDVSPDGRWVATGTWRGDGAKIWDARQGTLERELPVKGSTSVLFSPDGGLLVTGSAREYTLWDSATWTALHHLDRSQVGGLPGLAAFRSDGAILAMASTRTRVDLLDVSTKQILAELEAPDSRLVSDLRFCPDGGLLVAAPNSPQVWAWHVPAIRQGLADLGLDWVDSTGSWQVDSAGPAAGPFVVKPAPWLAAYDRGEELARSGRWREAIATYREAVEHGDPGVEVWGRLALLHLLDGDSSGYQEVCQRLLRDFATGDPAAILANQVAWACALGPGSVNDYSRAVELAEQSVASRPETNRLNTLGAILFRAGRSSEAVIQLERSVANHGSGGTLYDAVFLALVHHELGHDSEAREWLGRANLPAPLTLLKPDELAQTSWVPRLELELLRREASARIVPSSP